MRKTEASRTKEELERALAAARREGCFEEIERILMALRNLESPLERPLKTIR